MNQAYLFILGRQPELSLAELFGYAEGRKIDLEVLETTDSVAVISGDLPEPRLWMEHLAGIVKIASANSPVSRPANINEWVAILEPTVVSFATSKQSLTFGLSFYGEPKHCPARKEQEQIALSLKRLLKSYISHLRWVSGPASPRLRRASRGKPLSSVQVAKNKLTSAEGCELVIYCSAKAIVVGKTLAVQAFEEWNRRDYNRPRRDAKRGMLPPKLARMMVNMLGMAPQDTLLDPFCGSGTVLTEAAMLGWTELIGADKSARAAHDARANMDWLRTHYPLQKLFSNSRPALPAGRELENSGNVGIFICPIENLLRHVAPSSVLAIATEPYLGTPFVSPPSPAAVNHLRGELLPLYNNMLKVFAEVLTINGRAIFIAPRWFLADGREMGLATANLHWPKNLRVLNPLQTLFQYKNPPLIYKRSQQFVAREIIILEKVSS